MDRLEVDFILLVNTVGRHVALPRELLEDFVVPAEEHEAVYEALEDAATERSPGWGYCGTFTAEVPAAWWAARGAGGRGLAPPFGRFR